MVSHRFGPCVCIEDHGGYFSLRYHALHLASGRPIWAGNTDGEHYCTFQAEADAKSRYVLTLEGAYPFDEQPTETDDSVNNLFSEAIGYVEHNIRHHMHQLTTLRELGLPDDHPAVVKARTAVADSETLLTRLKTAKRRATGSDEDTPA